MLGDMVGAVRALATSDLLDLDPVAAVCATAMRLLGQKRVVAGRVRTVRCFEDNALLKSVVGEASAGEVLVVDGGGSLRTALMGDQVASAAMRNGWAGVLVFGAVRDSEAIEGMAFHVKCLGVHPRKSAKTGAGERDVTLSLGGVEFVAGQFVASDADGIVVMKQWPGVDQRTSLGG